MDLPPSVQLTKRSLLRWFAVSFGFLSEQESRHTILNVLDALFHFLLTKKHNPTTLEIQSYIDKRYHKRISEKLIRYHLNRLIALELLQRKSNSYCLNNSPYAEPDSLQESFNHWVKQPANSAMDDIANVLAKIADSYRK